MAFIPIIVPRKNEKFRLIVGVLLIVLGLFVVSIGLTIPNEAIDVTTVSSDALEVRKHFYIEDAVILDQFGYTTQDGKTTSYECAVAFGMADDEWIITALNVPVKSELYTSVSDYLNDTTQNIGDLRMPMYVKVATLDSEFCTFLDSYVDEVIGEDQTDYTIVKVKLQYLGSDEAAYEKSVTTDRISFTVIGAAVTVFGGLLFGLGLGQRRKRLEAIQSAAMAGGTDPERNT